MQAGQYFLPLSPVEKRLSTHVAAFSHGLSKILLVFKLCCIRLFKLFLNTLYVLVLKLLVDVISL